jgi:hypothetical protein
MPLKIKQKSNTGLLIGLSVKCPILKQNTLKIKNSRLCDLFYYEQQPLSGAVALFS